LKFVVETLSICVGLSTVVERSRVFRLSQDFAGLDASSARALAGTNKGKKSTVETTTKMRMCSSLAVASRLAGAIRRLPIRLR